jgi:deoxyribonuclease IV
MSLRFRTAADLLGAHVSTAGGVETAFERAGTIGATAIAIFSKNSNQWNAKPLSPATVAAFRSAWKASPVKSVITHASYLINLGTPDDALWNKSIDAMIVELVRAEELGAHAVVLHPGAHVGAGVDFGVARVAKALDVIHEAIPDCRVATLLETSAGQGSSLGCRFEELGRMIESTRDRSRLGICFDTCHVFAAGYDIRTKKGYEATVRELLRSVPRKLIGAVHLNDSKRELGSRVDRHELIGHGHIGPKAFELLLNDPVFRGVPKVLETPKITEFGSDIEGLRLLRSMLGRGAGRGRAGGGKT